MKCYCLLFFLFFVTFVKAQTLHSIIIKGQLREGFNEVPPPNLTLTIDFSQQISFLLSIKKEITSLDFSKKHVDLGEKISNLSFKKDDLIVVYYTGFGGCSIHEESEFPQSLLNNDVYIISADSLSLNKKAKFYSFIYDCSNICNPIFYTSYKTALKYKSIPSNKSKSNGLFDGNRYVMLAVAKRDCDAFVTSDEFIFLLRICKNNYA